MRSRLWCLVLCMLFMARCSAQDLTGYWQGVLYQPNGPFTTYFPFSMQLVQSGNAVTGSSYAILPGSSAYDEVALTGTVTNNVLVWQQTQVISQIGIPGGYWCLDNGTLTYNAADETLKGPWSAPTCAPGTIELWRLKMISDTIFCQGQPISLSVTGQNVKWYSDKGLTNLVSTGNSFSPSITQTTTYYLTQTHYSTESPALPVTITIKPIQVSSISQTICEGETFLGYTQSGTYTDKFSAANGCDSVRTLTLIVLPKSAATVKQSICEGEAFLGYTQPGTYTDKFVAANGCDSFRTLILTVLSRSTSTINQTICEGGAFLGYTQSGTYTDKFVAANGCDSIRTLNLMVLPKSASTVNQSICDGQSFLGYSQPGTYIDKFVGANGCDSLRTLILTVLTLPNPSLGSEINLCTGDSVVLNPGEFSTYHWQDGSSTNYFVAYESGIYTVDVTNPCGSAKATVVIKDVDCTIRFPKAFTPNGDGQNDLFRILHAYNLRNFHLSIYNRWGQMLFQTENYSTGWDGTFKGRPQPAGVYVWSCQYTQNNSPVTLNGTVTLIR